MFAPFNCMKVCVCVCQKFIVAFGGIRHAAVRQKAKIEYNIVLNLIILNVAHYNELISCTVGVELLDVQVTLV